jgi:hypothetical protein
MSKEDEFVDFRDQLKKLKNEKKNKSNWDQEDVNDVIKRVKSEMLPVIKAFVDTDRTLEMQSNTSRAIYISYANSRIYGLLVSATSLDRINIDAVFDSYSTRIYSGSFIEKEIKTTVKNALLDWYRRII